MNQVVILLSNLQYETVRQLLLGQLEILKNKTVLFSGTKTISADIIAVSMLNNRYQFMYHVDDVFADYGNKRDFKFRLYEVAALSYFLSDCAGLPDHIDRLNEQLRAFIQPQEYNQKKSDFQIWVEEIIFGWDWQITYTELRDQWPIRFKELENEYDSEIESK